MNPDDLAVLAQTLRVDAMTEEVLGALAAAGVNPVLLKGPVIANWLYADGGRTYLDCDLLIAPHQRERAEAVLTALGFARRPRDWELPDRVEHDGPWDCPQRGTVDVHRSLPGVHGVAPETVWRVLTRHRRRVSLPGGSVEATALDEPGLALLVGLHAAHHGDDAEARRKPLADLERAFARTPLTTWRDAARLARRLRCAGQLARGLHMVPGGSALALNVRLPAPAAGPREPDPPGLLGRARAFAASRVRRRRASRAPARA